MFELHNAKKLVQCADLGALQGGSSSCLPCSLRWWCCPQPAVLASQSLSHRSPIVRSPFPTNPRRPSRSTQGLQEVKHLERLDPKRSYVCTRIPPECIVIKAMGLDKEVGVVAYAAQSPYHRSAPAVPWRGPSSMSTLGTPGTSPTMLGTALIMLAAHYRSGHFVSQHIPHTIFACRCASRGACLFPRFRAFTRMLQPHQTGAY